MSDPGSWEWRETKLRRETCARLFDGEEELLRLDNMALCDIDPELSVITEIPALRQLLADCRGVLAASHPELVERIDHMLVATRTDRPFSKEEFLAEFQRRTCTSFADCGHEPEEVYDWMERGETAQDAVTEYIVKYGLDDADIPMGI